MDTAAATEPIRSHVVGSFPWSVLHDRHPALLQQVREAHPYPPDRRRAIDELEQEINGPIGPLTDTAADASTWADRVRPYLGQSWYDVPFLWAENYFYRRLLAAVGYLEPGPWQGIDPFEPLKTAELNGPVVDAELAALDGLAELTQPQRLDALLLAALWGNRADLSFLIGGGRVTDGVQADHLVVDDRAALRHLLAGSAPGPVVLVADNAGRELLPDLILIDELLVTGSAAAVVLHVKPRPYFVSDATTADVLAAINRLIAGPSREASTASGSAGVPTDGSGAAGSGATGSGAGGSDGGGSGAAQAIGRRLWAAIDEGRLTIRADMFSVAPFGYRDLIDQPTPDQRTVDHQPNTLRADLAAAKLTIMKGDLNYRRLVGDRNWPATTLFAGCTDYFPGPVVALRTLKSDVVVGLNPTTLTTLDNTGTKWRTSGTYGLIQARP